MREERWVAVGIGDESLSEEEAIEGWHFCPYWDDLLVGPGMKELEFCQCGEHLMETEEN